MNVPLSQAEAHTKWESYCQPDKGCGIPCCHHDGSPCEELGADGRCQVYATRFGPRRTVDGRWFQCVPMMVWLKTKKPPAVCGYARITSINGRPLSTRREEVAVVVGQP